MKRQGCFFIYTIIDSNLKNLNDEETRNTVMEYFVDKIYVYNNRIVITWFYSEDATEMSLDTLTEISKPKARGKKSRENRENDDNGLDEKGSLLMRLSPYKKHRIYGAFCFYVIYCGISYQNVEIFCRTKSFHIFLRFPLYFSSMFTNLT